MKYGNLIQHTCVCSLSCGRGELWHRIDLSRRTVLTSGRNLAFQGEGSGSCQWHLQKKREKRSPCDGEVENVCEWVWNLISIPITTVRQLNVHVTDNCLLVLSVCKGSVLTATAVAQSGPLQEYPAATSQGWWSPHKPKEHTGIKLASSHKITTVAKLQHISDYIVTLTIPLDLNVWRRGLHSRWTWQRSLRCARSGQSDDWH